MFFSFNNFTINNILYFNIIALPFILVTGPFLSDVLVTINAILFLIIVIKKKKYDFFKKPLILILLLSWILFIISSVFSEFKLYSLKSSLPYFRFILFLGSFYLLKEKLLKIDFAKFFAFILPIIVISMDVIFQSIFNFNIIGITTLDPSRNSSFFGDEYISGSYIVRTVPLALLYLHLFFEKLNQKKFNTLLLIFLFICTLGTFLSGERTAFFLMLLFDIYLLITYSKLRPFRIFFSITLVTSILIILIFNKPIYSRMIVNTLNDVGVNTIIKILKSEEIKISSNKNFFSSFTPYFSHYYTSILIYKDNKIFGMGPKNFRKMCLKDPYIVNSFSCTTHPHNTWIQILSETGVFPFIILISLFLVVIKKTIIYFKNNLENTHTNKNDKKIIILGGILITLWPLIPSGNFFNNWLSIVYFLPVGFYLILNEK